MEGETGREIAGLFYSLDSELDAVMDMSDPGNRKIVYDAVVKIYSAGAQLGSGGMVHLLEMGEQYLQGGTEALKKSVNLKARAASNPL